MKTVICDISALEYHSTPPVVRDAWLSEARLTRELRTLSLQRAFSSKLEEARTVRHHLLGSLKSVPLPVHVLSAGAMHESTRLLHWHRFTSGPEPDELIQIGEDLFVTSPLLTLRHLSRRIGMLHLLRLMFEMCGLFAISTETRRSRLVLDDLQHEGCLPSGGVRWAAFYDCDGNLLTFPAASDPATHWSLCVGRDGKRTPLWKRPPLFDVDAITDYAARIAPTRGTSDFVRASQLVQPGSGSPKETDVALALCLPRRLGGEGLGWFKCNRMVPLGAEAARSIGSDICVLDGSWDADVRMWSRSLNPRAACAAARERGLPVLPVSIEVDGVGFHSAYESMVRDRIRQTALAQMGLDAISVTPAQLGSSASWDAFVHVLAERLGITLPDRTERFVRQRRRLREVLLGRDPLGRYW